YITAPAPGIVPAAPAPQIPAVAPQRTTAKSELSAIGALPAPAVAAANTLTTRAAQSRRDAQIERRPLQTAAPTLPTGSPPGAAAPQLQTSPRRLERDASTALPRPPSAPTKSHPNSSEHTAPRGSPFAPSSAQASASAPAISSPLLT